MSAPATFAAVAVTIYAAHQVGDYWVQTSNQAARKGLPGRGGERACLAHVFTYTLTLGVFLGVACGWLGLSLSPLWVFAGLYLSVLTHYFADRRKPLERLAGKLGKSGFYEAGSGLATGAALLDQAWHYCWLFVSALVISGPPS